MAAFIALSIGFAILAGFCVYLWLRLRTQEQAWSWQLDRLKEYVARLDTREAVDKQFGDLRQEISLLSAAMGEETRKAFEARRDFDHILQDFHERLDAAEADLRQELSRLSAALASQATMLDSQNSLVQLTVTAQVDVKQWADAFDQRLDAAEAKLDIPQKRQRLRAPFSQLRGQIKSEPYKPEPNRWNADGTRVGEEVEAKA